MNEIKHIHLGRQPFTIAVDAHQELRRYLDAIQVQVGDKGTDVVEEVELRMAELLHEHGVSGGKVIVEKDVQFLKSQLGEPRDFKDDEGEASPKQSAPNEVESQPRRLFRDTEHGMIAGVAAGLAAYCNIDPLIVRLLFVALTFAGGTGIIIYIVLWLLAPEAKTSSERLQMRGKAVTVESLKEVIDRADVPGAAARASKAGRQIGRGVGRSVEGAAKGLLGVVGIGLVAAASALFLGVITLGTYMLAHGVQIANEVVFPVGVQAMVGLFCVLSVLCIVAFCILIAGLAMVKRRAVVKGWVVAVAVGLFVVAGGLGAALGFDIVPAIRDKYRAMHHVQTYQLPAFRAVTMSGKDTNYSFVPDATYSVEIRYFGGVKKASAVTKQVADGVLTLNTDAYQNESRTCNALCLYSGDLLEIVIHAPSLLAAGVSGSGNNFSLEHGLVSDSSINNFTLSVAANSQAFVSGVHAQKITVDSSQHATYDKFSMEGVKVAIPAGYPMSIAGGAVHINQTDELLLVAGNHVCDGNSAIVQLDEMPQKTSINDTEIASRAALQQRWSQTTPNAYNCLLLYER